MTNYEQLLSSVQRFVREEGVACAIRKRAPITEAVLSGLEQQAGLSLPAEVRAMVVGYADGVRISWSAEDDEGPFANLELPTTRHLIQAKTRWVQDSLWMGDAELAKLPDPAAAQRMLERMKSWWPLATFGDGNAICVEGTGGAESVVYHEHDWFDVGSGKHGVVVAASWEAFLEAWAEVCFQMPASLYWPTVLSAEGVDWSSSGFSERFRLRVV